MADPLPEGKSDELIKTALITASEQTINPQKVMSILSLKSNSEKNRVNEVLWRVQERVGPTLKSQPDLKREEIENLMIKETAQILKKQDSVQDELSKNFGLSKEISKLVTFQSLLYEAKNGKAPSNTTIDYIQEVVTNHTKNKNFESLKESSSLALEKTLSCVIEGNIRETHFDREYAKEVQKAVCILSKENRNQVIAPIKEKGVSIGMEK